MSALRRRRGAHVIHRPDQGATGIPVRAVRLEENKVVLEAAAAQGSYEGILTSPAKITGHRLRVR